MVGSIGGHEVVRELARGGMGVLHEVVDPVTGARRALKTLRAARPEELLRFRREAELLARLDHPAVVRIHTAGVEPGPSPLAYLVMDLLPGGSLQDRIDRGPLPLALAVEYAVALARGVEHAHAHGVLHRDLKPRNVVFDGPHPVGRPRLVDFGLARAREDAERLTATGAILGTPEYMAPEQAAGREVDARTDVYGLGALLFAMLTGRPPREGQGAVALLAAAVDGRAPCLASLRPDAPPALVAVCLRALAAAPADRFQSAGAFADALESPTIAAAPRGRLGPALGLVAAAALAALAALARSCAEPGPAPVVVTAPPAKTPPEAPRALDLDPLVRAVACAAPGRATGSLDEALGAELASPTLEVKALRIAARLLDDPLAAAPEDSGAFRGIARAIVEIEALTPRLERREIEGYPFFVSDEHLVRWSELVSGALVAARADPGGRALAWRTQRVLGRALVDLQLHPFWHDDPRTYPMARQARALGPETAPLDLFAALSLLEANPSGAGRVAPPSDSLPPDLAPLAEIIRVTCRAPGVDSTRAEAAYRWQKGQSPLIRNAGLNVRRLGREAGRYHRRDAWRALAASGGLPSPEVRASLALALDRGRARAEGGLAFGEEGSQFAISCMLLGGIDEAAREDAVRSARSHTNPPGQWTWRRPLLLAEVELAWGDPAAALALLAPLEAHREVALARAHALRLGDAGGWEDALARALVIPGDADDLGIDWRARDWAEGVVRGTTWWPGRKR